MKNITLLILLFGLFSCSENESRPGRVLSITPLPFPCEEGGMPNLFRSESGQVYLSWIEFTDDSTDALMFCPMGEDGQWGEATEIARGSDWFVNWADFPALAAFPGQEERLLAYWLQKSETGTYDYDIAFSLSTRLKASLSTRLKTSLSANGGKRWSKPQILNDDGVAAEHGFVSLTPLPSGDIQALWLDGRHTKGEDGAMSLRTTTISPEGDVKPSQSLDERTCDCCQTDMVYTPAGLVAAYRDRSVEEIRDIALVRHTAEGWSKPAIPHADRWKIAGCPVNGPALATDEEQLVMVWYTGAGDSARVQCSFSKDFGKTFGPVFRIDDGHPLGRVDVELSDRGTAYITWLEKTDGGAEIRLREINASGEALLTHSLIKTNPSRASGFPILLRSGKSHLLLAYTQVGEDKKLQAKCVEIEME